MSSILKNLSKFSGSLTLIALVLFGYAIYGLITHKFLIPPSKRGGNVHFETLHGISAYIMFTSLLCFGLSFLFCAQYLKNTNPKYATSKNMINSMALGMILMFIVFFVQIYLAVKGH